MNLDYLERDSAEQGTVKSLNITTVLNGNITFQYLVPKKAKNKAKVLLNNQCLEGKRTLTKEFTFVTNYIPINRYRKIYNLQERQVEEEARIYEILGTYQKNLNHPMIKFLYIFVKYKESVDLLQNTLFKNSSKLVIIWSKEGVEPIRIFPYISKCLEGELVMYGNSDISVGEGFEKIDPKIIKEKKLMYALTRYSTYDTYGICDPKKWPGNSDTFLFFAKNFTLADFEIMAANKWNEPGRENLLIYMFEKKLGYKVMNPCKVLKTYHEHRVNLRNRQPARVNLKYSGKAEITDQLY